MTDEWASEDLPVLEAVRKLERMLPAGQYMDGQSVANVTGFEHGRVIHLTNRLVKANYLLGEAMTIDTGVIHEVYVTGLAERGRRVIGQWPSEDPWANLIDLLQRQIDEEPDAERHGKLVRFRDGVLSGGRAIGVSLLTKYLEQQAGLA
jgi:hypothetical protein